MKRALLVLIGLGLVAVPTGAAVPFRTVARGSDTDGYRPRDGFVAYTRQQARSFRYFLTDRDLPKLDHTDFRRYALVAAVCSASSSGYEFHITGLGRAKRGLLVRAKLLQGTNTELILPAFFDFYEVVQVRKSVLGRPFPQFVTVRTDSP